MTEPYDLNKEEALFERLPSSWIERVRMADAEAEARWRAIERPDLVNLPTEEMMFHRSLIAIAAELRAARIARRPGAGQ